jgi:hypothetical protein
MPVEARLAGALAAAGPSITLAAGCEVRLQLSPQRPAAR